MSGSASDSHQVVRDRVGLDRKVQLRFDKFQDFLTEIAGNISPGGMFVRSDDPHAAGERFEFECSLADGYPLVSGRAEVVWIRERADSEARPSGMGVRFLELRDRSEMLIRKIVEQRLKDGKGTFQLDAERPPSEQVETSETAPSEETGSADFSEVSTTPTAPAVSGKPRPSSAGATNASQAAEAATPPPKSPPPARVAPPAPEQAVSTRTPAPEPRKDPEPPVAPPAAAISPEPRKELEPPVAPASATSSPKPRKDPEPPIAPPSAASSPKPSKHPEPPVAPPSAAASLEPLEDTVPPVVSPAAAISPPVRSPVSGPGNRPVGRAPRPSRSRLSARRLAELVLLSFVVGAFMVLAFHQYWFRPQIERLDARLDELTGSSRVGGAPGFAARRDEPEGRAIETGEGAGRVDSVGSQETAPPQPDLPVVEDASSESDPVAPTPAESIQETVQSWAKAWSEQRVDDYLGYYAPDFVPASGGSRREWQERRRERLSAQGAIRVAVVSFQVEEISASEARVAFTQSYQSNAYRDRVRKNLRLVRADDGWKIAEEVVIRQLPW